MRIVRAGLRAFAIPLRRPLATAHGVITTRDGFLVSLEDEAGRVGQGEAMPLPAFGTEDPSACRAALETGLARLTTGGTLEASPQEIAAARLATPCARAALEGAMEELAARGEGRSLAARLRARAGLPGPPASHVRVQALVSGASPEQVAANAGAAKASGFDAFKLKLAVEPGRVELARDLERVAALREAVGPAALLRLDANEAFDRAQARAACAALARFGVDCLEQPVARDDVAGLASLTAEGIVPIAADEALLGAGLETCLAARAADVFVVKPAALGGLSRALELWRRAREASIAIVWSSLVEAEVGLSTALALAAALAAPGGPGGSAVHGLGTADWLARGLSGGEPGPKPRRGRLAVSDAAGLGLDLPPVWSARGDVFVETLRLFGAGA